MLKKRLIGVVTVRQGLAVQSFGYSRYLPLGSPELVIENLDRWGADEILVQCIDRSVQKLGPDFSLLKRVGDLGLSTPLIYGGGIRHTDDAVKVISLGADRILIDSILWDSQPMIEAISRELGVQAVIANMPVHIKLGQIYWRNYRSSEEVLLNINTAQQLPIEWISEILLTDWRHEGFSKGFDRRIPLVFPIIKNPFILFGGLSEYDQYTDVLSIPNVVGVGIGNFLSYKEHAIQNIKDKITAISLRTAHYTAE